MTVELHGFCDARFAAIKTAMQANFDEGLDHGASVAVMLRGEPVVELWGGWRDWGRTRPWERDTVVQVFSTSKVLLALCILMLVDRGQVDLDAPVSRYWPAFGQGGKEKVTVREAMTHRAGVPGFRPPVAFEDLHDWEGITARVAATPHWFGGETTICYHPVTWGLIMGTILQRVDGRDIDQFVREEVARRLGADYQLRLTAEADTARVADPVFLPPEPGGLPPIGEEILASVGHGPWMTPERFSALIPGSNAYTNGLGIAQVCAVLAGGGAVNGVRYVAEAVAQEACTTQAEGIDAVFGSIRLGLALGLDHAGYPAPTCSCAHWGGYGGSWALFDPVTQVGFGFTPNLLEGGSPRMAPRLVRFRQALAAILPTLTP